MDIRALPVSQGLGWFKQAIDLGARNPRAVFGAALLMIVGLYTAVLLVAMVAAMGAGIGAEAGDGASAEPDLRRLLLVAAPLFLLIMLLVPMLLGGLMHVIREAEAGRPVRARDVFAPFAHARGRRLALLGLVQIGLAILGGALFMAVAGGDYWRDYLEAIRGAMSGSMPAMPEPRYPGLLLAMQLAFNYFTYAIMLFSIPLVLFSGQGLGAAVRDSLRAAVRNLAPNLLAGVLFMGALLVGALVAVLLVGLMVLLGSLVHAVVGSLLGLMVGLGFASVALVLVVGAAYLAWRDTFGDESAPAPPVSAHGIEV